VFALATFTFLSASAQTRKEFRYTVGPKANIVVVNRFGPISVRPSGSNQVIATATLHSAKVQVDDTHNPSRVELRTHLLQNVSPQEGQVDFDLQVPADAMVNVRSATGALTAQGLQGDLMLVGDAGPVVVHDLSNAHVHVKTLSGPVTLSNLSNGQVDVTSVGGDINMNAVNGRNVTVNTGSGEIDVTIPQNASVDITARSVTGSVQNDFPLTQKAVPAVANPTGRSFAGTSSSGSSSVQLRSFSGKIRLKKQ
jgi:DUF4097 and DUF4098 domain-containing protein YvlB